MLKWSRFQPAANHISIDSPFQLCSIVLICSLCWHYECSLCLCLYVWASPMGSLERHQMKMTRISTSGRAAAFPLFNMRRNPHGSGVKTGMNNWCGVVPQSTFFQLIGFKESEGWNIIIQPGVRWNGRWGRIIAPPSRIINPGCQLVRCSIWCFKGYWHVIFRDKRRTAMTLSPLTSFTLRGV